MCRIKCALNIMPSWRSSSKRKYLCFVDNVISNYRCKIIQFNVSDIFTIKIFRYRAKWFYLHTILYIKDWKFQYLRFVSNILTTLDWVKICTGRYFSDQVRPGTEKKNLFCPDIKIKCFAWFQSGSASLFFHLWKNQRNQAQLNFYK